MRPWARGSIAAAIALASAVWADDDDEVFLGRLPITAAPGADIAAERLRVRIELNPNGVSAAGSLAAWFPDARVEASSVVFTLGRETIVGGKVEPHHLASTFLVDHDDPAVRSLVSQIRESVGQAPDLNQLASRVYRHISKKNLSRGLDAASRVAAHGEGDCTEHSVLLTALARASRRPARSITGLLLLVERGRWRAFGHAWNEVYDGGAWRLVDATFPPANRVRYLPLSAIVNEGPGYSTPSKDELLITDVTSVMVEPILVRTTPAPGLRE